MINNIGSSQGFTSLPRGQFNLTSQQSEDLQKVLGDYDASDLSDEEAKEITEKIKDIGIQPGQGLAEALKTEGFDAQGLAEQAGLGKKGGSKGEKPSGPPPPGAGGPPKGEVNNEAITALQLIIESAETDEASELTWDAIVESMEEQGFDMSQPLVNILA